jgi:hypothetical protein
MTIVKLKNVTFCNDVTSGICSNVCYYHVRERKKERPSKIKSVEKRGLCGGKKKESVINNTMFLAKKRVDQLRKEPFATGVSYYA